jgi:hypothetical protein
LKLKLVLDRFYNPPEKFYCDGKEYTSEFAYLMARRALFKRNVKLKLSKDYHLEKLKKLRQNGIFENSERLSETDDALRS